MGENLDDQQKGVWAELTEKIKHMPRLRAGLAEKEKAFYKSVAEGILVEREYTAKHGREPKTLEEEILKRLD